MTLKPTYPLITTVSHFFFIYYGFPMSMSNLLATALQMYLIISIAVSLLVQKTLIWFDFLKYMQCTHFSSWGSLTENIIFPLLRRHLGLNYPNLQANRTGSIWLISLKSICITAIFLYSIFNFINISTFNQHIKKEAFLGETFVILINSVILYWNLSIKLNNPNCIHRKQYQHLSKVYFLKILKKYLHLYFMIFPNFSLFFIYF